MKNSTCRIVQNILYSPNRTNRSNRQALTRVPEYREIFLSVANEMQMSDGKPSKTFSIRQIERIGQTDKLQPGSQNIVKYFELSRMRCKCQMENSICRIVQNILYSPNRTNRSNRQASTPVPEYRKIFLSVANDMQVSDGKLYLSDRPKHSLFAK